MPSGSLKSTLRPRPAPAVESATQVSPALRPRGCCPAGLQPERGWTAGWTPRGRAGRGPGIPAAARTVAVPDTARDGDERGGLRGRLVGHGRAERAVSARCPRPGDLSTPGAQAQLQLPGCLAMGQREGGGKSEATMCNQGAEAGFGAPGQVLLLLGEGVGSGVSEAPELCEALGLFGCRLIFSRSSGRQDSKV